MTELTDAEARATPADAARQEGAVLVELIATRRPGAALALDAPTTGDPAVRLQVKHPSHRERSRDQPGMLGEYAAHLPPGSSEVFSARSGS